MLSLVHRPPFRRVFLVFVFLLSGSISAVRAAAPTPTPTPTPTPGQLDTTFVPAPGTNDAVNIVIPQPDGKVIAAGRFTFANGVARNRIARFNSNGSLDTTFDPGTGADGEITAAVLQPDGRIVVAGLFTSFNGFTHNRVCRLNANGSVDQTFGLGNGINTAALALALQSDGRIIVGGNFTQVDLTLRNFLARLNTNGSVDLSFDPGNGPSGNVNAIVLQPDGRIIIGGTFIGYNGFARGGIARVLANGALDPSFDSGVGTGGNVFALALQHNGQIVLGGSFVQDSGTNRSFIARVFGDGSLDFGFNPVPNSWVQSLAVEPDDRILVGGLFIDIDGFGRNRIARLNTNGSVDLTFDPGAGCVGSLTNDATQVHSIALQQFGRILAGGIFTSYDNQLRDNIVRLFDNAAPVAYDFNQDGKPDYVLFNAVTHQTAVWYLNNNVFLSAAFGPTLPANWNVVGVADFDGDGRPDYLLFNSTSHQTAIWYLSGTTFVSSAFGPTLPNGWNLVAVGDFNADGKPDYVLYNAVTHQTAIWSLNNNVFVGSAFGPTLPVNWRVVGVADFDGDGKPDYLLFNSSTGQTAIWYLSGPTLVASAFGPTIVSGYTLIGAADFDRDGKPDYALYNSAMQQTAVRYLNNNAFTSSAFGPSLPASWSLIAP